MLSPDRKQSELKCFVPVPVSICSYTLSLCSNGKRKSVYSYPLKVVFVDISSACSKFFRLHTLSSNAVAQYRAANHFPEKRMKPARFIKVYIDKEGEEELLKN